uniref:Splicing factor n=1 Tax=Tanacetum cinerariifolium TaxID=118510 RepID=A0A699GMN1_TANCI|nr:splicing factor [Tanacetum cinerariifolium]
MSKDKPKLKKSKGVFTVNLYHDGIFAPSPIKYLQGELKHITDIDFKGMSFEQLTKIIRRLVLGLMKSLFYCKTGKKLRLGIKELKSDSDVEDFLKLGYDNGFMVNLYIEHYGYNVIDFLNYENVVPQFSDYSDVEYSSVDGEDLENVDYYTIGEEDVIIKNLTTHDDFLNRLCSTGGLFRVGVPKPGSSLPNIPKDDPDGSTIEAQFKVKRGTVYQVLNPDIPWNQVEPVLGIRWIACQCADRIIKDPFIPLRTMKEDIRQALIDSNPGRTCKLDVEDISSGKAFLQRMYICFKGVKDGCLTIIFDSHKTVADWLPQAEHRKCTRNFYANFKKKYSGYMHLNKDPVNGVEGEVGEVVEEADVGKVVVNSYKLQQLVIYSRGPLTTEQEHYLRQDEKAVREHLEEEVREEQEYLDRYRDEQEYEARMDWMHESHWKSDKDMPASNPTQPTQQSGVQQV